VIFCRNVMIYFDQPTKERLVARLAQALVPGGFLYIGQRACQRPARRCSNLSAPRFTGDDGDIRVLIIDDSATMRAVLAARLSGHADIQVVGLQRRGRARPDQGAGARCGDAGHRDARHERLDFWTRS
jgi:SAM-dependent methyltransferase